MEKFEKDWCSAWDYVSDVTTTLNFGQKMARAVNDPFFEPVAKVE